jgi:hypothetical protein
MTLPRGEATSSFKLRFFERLMFSESLRMPSVRSEANLARFQYTILQVMDS